MDRERVKFERKHMKLYSEMKAAIDAINVQMGNLSSNLDQSLDESPVPPKVIFTSDALRIANRKSQIANRKSQIANRKSQNAKRKSQNAKRKTQNAKRKTHYLRKSFANCKKKKIAYKFLFRKHLPRSFSNLNAIHKLEMR